MWQICMKSDKIAYVLMIQYITDGNKMAQFNGEMMFQKLTLEIVMTILANTNLAILCKN